MDESLNDFIKINNNRLAFIYSNSSHGCIIIININEITKDISYNDYYINFYDFKPTIQISGFSYNGYLLFVTTLEPNYYYS